jgi:hypothetical protein
MLKSDIPRLPESVSDFSDEDLIEFEEFHARMGWKSRFTRWVWIQVDAELTKRGRDAATRRREARNAKAREYARRRKEKLKAEKAKDPYAGIPDAPDSSKWPSVDKIKLA